MSINIKSKSEVDKMRVANRIVAETHLYLEEFLKEGVSTYELDRVAEEFINKQGAIPSFKGYQGFPKAICTSLNDVVVHGIPKKEDILTYGDIISIDIGAYINGYHGDAARTHVIGKTSEINEKLIQVTRESFFEGMKFVKEGNHLHQISAAIQKHVESNGFSVVRDLVGHGVGKDLHEDPQIPNFKPIGRGPKLQAGMVLAIEPMVNIGGYEVAILDDDWTIVTVDGSYSAHYEHTLLVTKDGYELLTEV